MFQFTLSYISIILFCILFIYLFIYLYLYIIILYFFYFIDSIIKLDKPRPVNHNEIGKYFSAFKGTFYMPNEILKEEYPDDVLYLMSQNQQ